MSRIGKLPIALPSGVTVSVAANEIQVKGPKGTLKHFVPDHVDITIDGGKAVVNRQSDMRQARANHGLMRAVLRNMVQGVTQGFEKKLELHGVGFRAEVKGKSLVLNIGYSHQVEYPIPQGIAMAVDKSGVISITGMDKQQVGQVASEIRAYRKPDAYKGKGLRYAGEHVRLKAGKSAK